MWQYNYSDELYHHGILGMKWGHHSAGSSGGSSKSARRKADVKSYQNDNKVKRFNTYDAGNSAARSFYRAERTSNFKTYKKQTSARNLKEARLSETQIKDGRYRVAKARNIKRKTLSTVLGVGAGAALVASGAGFVGAAAAVPISVVSNFASGGHYYSRQQRAYGNTRSNYAAKSGN